MTKRLSLRLRLLLAIAATSLVGLVLLDGIVYGALSAYEYGQVDNTLEASHSVVEQAAESSGRPNAEERRRIHSGQLEPGGTSDFCAAGRESAPGMFIEVIGGNGKPVVRSEGLERCPAFEVGNTSYQPDIPKVVAGYLPTGPDSEPAAYFTVDSAQGRGPAFRVRAAKLPNGEVLILAAPIANVTDTLSRLLVIEGIVTAGALLATVMLGLWLVRVGLRPLRDVERTAEAIALGDLDERAPHGDERSEVGSLARAFNLMLERVEGLVTDLRASERRLRRFVGDASHELRTPISAVSAYADLLQEGAVRSDEDLRRVVGGIAYESMRMAQLVEDLLTLARLDEHRGLESEPVELAGLAIEAVETSNLVGPEWLVEYRVAEPVEVMGDYAALRRLVDNLLSNVRAHTPPGTHALVSVTGSSEDEAVIEVADDGPGIGEAQAPHIFERFFRVDQSRTRETGGAGLGLAIVASIVQAHGGSVSAAVRREGGSVFTVRLPRLEPEADEVDEAEEEEEAQVDGTEMTQMGGSTAADPTEEGKPPEPAQA